jgi:hypothetical protein
VGEYVLPRSEHGEGHVLPRSEHDEGEYVLPRSEHGEGEHVLPRNEHGEGEGGGRGLSHSSMGSTRYSTSTFFLEATSRKGLFLTALMLSPAMKYTSCCQSGMRATYSSRDTSCPSEEEVLKRSSLASLLRLGASSMMPILIDLPN